MFSHWNQENTDEFSVIPTPGLLKSPIRTSSVGSTILPRAVGLHHSDLELAKLPERGVHSGEGSIVGPNSGRLELRRYQRLRWDDEDSVLARRSGSRRTCFGGGYLSGLVIPQTPICHGWGRGIVNDAQTCCIISVVQLLLHLPPIHSAIRNHVAGGHESLFEQLATIRQHSFGGDRDRPMSSKLVQDIYPLLQNEGVDVQLGEQLDIMEVLPAMVGHLDRDLRNNDSHVSLVGEWSMDLQCPRHPDPWPVACPILSGTGVVSWSHGAAANVQQCCPDCRSDVAVMVTAPDVLFSLCGHPQAQLPPAVSFTCGDEVITYVPHGGIYHLGEDRGAGHFVTHVKSPFEGSGESCWLLDDQHQPKPIHGQPEGALVAIAWVKRDPTSLPSGSLPSTSSSTVPAPPKPLPSCPEVPKESLTVPAPAKTRPAPTKTHPAPTKTRPAPTKTRPAPTKTGPSKSAKSLSAALVTPTMSPVEKMADHCCPSFTSALVEALRPVFHGSADSVVGKWEDAVRASKSSAADLVLEDAVADEREQRYLASCRKHGVDYPGMARPNGSDQDGIAMLLCWPPHHPHPRVLTTAKWTPRCLIRKGHQGYSLEALEVKQPGIDHQKLPAWRRPVRAMATTFPFAQRSPAHLEALSEMFETSLQRVKEVSTSRTSKPSLTIAQGTFAKESVLLALAGLTNRELRKHDFCLKFPASFISHTNPNDCALVRGVAFYTSVNSLDKSVHNSLDSSSPHQTLRGVFLFISHGSQGWYAIGHGSPDSAIRGYALDMAVNYAMSLQNVKVPGDEYWLYTTSSWPTGEISFRQMNEELIKQRGREITSGDVVDKDNLSPRLLSWIDAQCLELLPVDLTIGHTFLFTVLSALRRRESDLVPKEVKNSRVAQAHATRKANLAMRTEAEVIEDARREQLARAERQRQGPRVLRPDDRRRGPEARARGLKALSKVTPEVRARAAKPRCEAIGRRTAESELETGKVVSAVLQEDGGFFRWNEVDCDGIGATSANTRTDGLPGQMFTIAEWYRVSKASSAGYSAIEMWWCQAGLLYVRSTCRKSSSVSSSVDSRFSSSNSEVQLNVTNRYCLWCKATILGSGPKPKCRPVVGWTTLREFKVSKRDAGPSPDMKIPDLALRMEKTVGLVYHTGVSRRARKGGDNAPVSLTIAADKSRGAPFYLDLEQLPPPTVTSLFPNQKRRRAKEAMRDERKKAAATTESDACQPSEPPILENSNESANEEVSPRKKARKESDNISAQLSDVQYVSSDDSPSIILLSSPLPLVSTALRPTNETSVRVLPHPQVVKPLALRPPPESKTRTTRQRRKKFPAQSTTLLRDPDGMLSMGTRQTDPTDRREPGKKGNNTT
ncbi:hypothetical protein TREMEDRAFT_73370 [Tremella mesenterica DSM 1558]|uniref:uncharacterized protein n=1 Tax=Tremella mesenterica (strain ATCC 24925 / CBS 8224 / DSM 1558 / NBRC 9311 / NRRL Y-6157 / RJB 2259-6 / UBC 559-6) TaxID=578456 RepID=UPI0003F48C70|nr:uncharacterized protein TREMEDRAFT_73370 [Tremella mesenterica DSM 1558]EIW71661.1 hypothetical protein TREMEDRAFT_73370 [Tremella mesenterica DSM 1558]